MKEAVVVDACRSPIGRAGERGVFRDITFVELTLPVLKALIERNNLDPNLIDDIIMGSAGLPHYFSRVLVFQADLPHSIAAVTVNRMCASALTAIADGAHAISCNAADIIIAGGAETMDRLGPVQPEEAGQRGLSEASEVTVEAPPQKKRLPEGWKEAILIPPFFTKVEPWIFNMGLTAEKLAQVYGISRQDADAFALNSHRKAIAAQEAGKFDREIIPITIHYKDGSSVTIERDQCPRVDTSLEKLAALRPSFKEDGLVTAGNSCPRNDGAGAVLLMSKEKAKELGYKPLVTVRTSTVVGVDPTIMGIGPWPATQKLLMRTGMSIDDFDLVEVNEAFACQVLLVMRELGIKEERLNVNGGAIAIGHPLGMTGARLVGTIASEMIRRDVEWGLVTMCVGGGQGMAMALQREQYE